MGIPRPLSSIRILLRSVCNLFVRKANVLLVRKHILIIRMELFEKLANLKHSLSISIRDFEKMEKKDSQSLNFDEVYSIIFL